MANQLYDVLGGGKKTNSIFNVFGGEDAFRAKYNEFVNTVGSMRNFNPQAIVQNALNTGRMTQDQFNQIRQWANEISGQNH